jgi:hypothetical protein
VRRGMEAATGRPGELVERVLEAVDDPAPQLRAVATTLLIKALDVADDERILIDDMVASDLAAAMIDPVAAAEAGLRLRDGLVGHLRRAVIANGEGAVARVMRDYLVTHMQRWASRAVDDVDNRRRAERFLAWAERPEQLRAAQQRGLFAGMDAEELRRLADRRIRAPVTPETALDLWSQVDRWLSALDDRLSDEVIRQWERAAGGDVL